MRSFGNLTAGQYCAGSSILHHLDPRTKFICVLIAMAALFVVRDVIWILIFLFLVVILYRLAQIPLWKFWQNVKALSLLYVITFVIHLFIHPGDVLLKLPFIGWEISSNGVAAGILFTVRIAVLISISNLIMTVTTPQDITDGLERLLKPLALLRFPVSQVAMLISIALRFVPIMLREADNIRQAQIARGADFEGAWINRIKKFVPLMIPLFSCALKRADNLALALEARGYQGGHNRSRMIELRMGQNDVVAYVVVLIFTVVLFLFN